VEEEPVDPVPAGIVDKNAPRTMPPQFGALQKVSGNVPALAPLLVKGKDVYVVETKICVSTSGGVELVTITKRSDTELDANVLDAVKTWRYRPMKVNGAPVPFCYPARFEFRSEP
jgi:TonB family protein